MSLGYVDDFETYSMEESHIFNSTLVNSARIGALHSFGESNQNLGAINPVAADMALCDVPNAPACQLRITGIANLGGGAGTASDTTRGFTTPSFYDDASKVSGTHTIKFGFAYERQNLNVRQSPSAGVWNFGSLTGFLTNVPTSYQAPTQIAVTNDWAFRDTILGGYVQDDWSWRRNLTLNLGLRYEVLTNPTEARGHFGALTSLTGNAASVRVGKSIYQSNPTTSNVEPRVGFVWDPLQSGKTSVRGGYGIFDVLPMVYMWAKAITGTYPDEISAQNTKPPAGSFYNGIPQSALSASSYTVMYVAPSKRSYVQQWNLTLQLEITLTATVTVSYVGSHGTHLVYRAGASNAVVPTRTSAGYLYPVPIGTGAVINPNFGQIQPTYFSGTSSYNALEAQVNKRMSHGIQFQVSYTWGRSIDQTSSQVTPFDFANSINTNLDPTQVAKSYYVGPSDFNVDETLVANAIWRLPEFKSLPAFVGRVANGWQFGGIYRVAGGEPFSVEFGRNGNVTGANNAAAVDPDFPNQLKGSGCQRPVNPQNPANYLKLNCFTLPTAPDMAFWTANCDQTKKIYGSPATTEPYPVCLNLLGNAGRNSVIGPGLSDLDFSVFKNNKITEKINAQFRVEAFNILNRANFANPVLGTGNSLYSSTGVPSGSAGLLAGTSTTSRQIQFALKLIW